MNIPISVRFIYFILSSMFSIVLANFGTLVINDFPEKPYLGISIVILSFLLIFFADSLFRIRENTKKIRDLDQEVINIKQDKEVHEKLLNSLKEIVLLRKLKR